MPLSAFALALGAAFLHALWNLLLARARDPEAATAIALLVAVVAFAPVAALTWEADLDVWPYVLGSCAFELVYFALLPAAYLRSELSVVYPVARGLAPVLVLVVGIVALGAGSSAGQAVGVCLVGAGVVLVRGFGGQPDPAGIAFGVAIAGCIAGYTLVDNRGIELAAPITYLELTMVGPAVAYSAAMVARKGLPAVRAELKAPAVAAGLSTFAAYALVLAALERAAAAPVAAVRETSVVIATAAAAFVLRESVGPQRLAGAVLVAGGVALLGL